ncbi:MAG: cysteine-rich CWC family protein [Rhodoferax sp.]|jgi:hypothetical protein|nr:cysteine-rich CWC family protein [Rhodoferax sp.]
MTPINPLPALSPKHCPLCGQPNQCAMELQQDSGIEQPPCWCTQVRFSANLLDQIPASARGQACLCAACVNAHQPSARASGPSD